MPTAYIALGANLPGPAGPPEAALAAAVVRMGEIGRVTRRSRLYSTAPVGVEDQPRFVNAAVELETELTPIELMGALLGIEAEFGRDRLTGVPNGPRTLDLDILLYGDFVVHLMIAKVPHPRLAEREFVLVPLAEIASNHLVATHGATVQQLLNQLRNGLPPETDAITPIQSDVWSAADGGDAGVRRNAEADADGDG